MSAPVEICIEALQESQIQEVTLDGQEIYKPSLSMSENLTKLAHKIDFSKDESEGKGKPTSETVEADPNEEEEQKASEEAAAAALQPSQWPWDGVRTKMKAALTEMNVLLDVLNIAKDKRYMVLDAVVPSPNPSSSLENNEHKHAFLLMGKKKGLASAATILLNGADRMRRSQDVMARRTAPDFHHELLKLRNIWRLKRVGPVILGDLTYRSAGSQYFQNGSFEVRKTETETGSSSDNLDAPTPPIPQSVLQVIIPSELEGVAYIQVAVKRISDSTDLSSAELNLSGNISGSETNWKMKLEAAQNVLFCKEVFAQLAREAVQINSKIPHMVVGNQIFTHLFPGIQLSIALLYPEREKKSQVPPSPPRQHNPVLEHSLHQLLREQHYRNAYLPMPHPAPSVLGMSKRRRVAGPTGSSRQSLLEMTQTTPLLEQIVAQGRHSWVWQQSLGLLDELARVTDDPQLAVHFSSVTDATHSLISLVLTSAGYDAHGFRTPIALHIDVDTIRAVCSDGHVVTLSYEEQELRDFVLGQIAKHHITTAQSLSRILGWNALSLNMNVGVGDMEPVGNAHTFVTASPNGMRVLSIRSGPVSGLKVLVQKLGEPVNLPSIVDKNYNLLGGKFHPVSLDRIEGKTFVNKLELLMACLSQEQA